MQSALSANEILSRVHQDIQSCDALLSLLELERTALKERDMDELERVLTEKAQHLGSLEESANLRSELARNLSGGNDSEAWQNILSELKNENLNSSWSKLKDLLQRCKLENEVNGKLLARNHQVYSRLLDMVRGQTPGPSLYDAHGGSSNGGSTNIVGEA